MSKVMGQAPPFLCYDTVRGEAEYKQPPVSDKAKVGGTGDGNARVIVGRIADAVAIEWLRVKL